MTHLAPMAGYLILATTCGVMAQAIHAGWLNLNHTIGVRTKNTLKNETAWKVGHKAAFPYLLAAAYLAGAFLVLLIVLSILKYPAGVLDIATVTGFLSILGLIVVAGIRGNSRAKRYNDSMDHLKSE